MREISPREKAVMKLISQGRSNQQIAKRLGIAIGTVKIHVNHILTKTGKRSRLEIAVSELKKKKPRRPMLSSQGGLNETLVERAVGLDGRVDGT